MCPCGLSTRPASDSPDGCSSILPMPGGLLPGAGLPGPPLPGSRICPRGLLSRSDAAREGGVLGAAGPSVDSQRWEGAGVSSGSGLLAARLLRLTAGEAAGDAAGEAAGEAAPGGVAPPSGLLGSKAAARPCSGRWLVPS